MSEVSNKNVLLVDDDPDFLFQMRKQFEALGFTVFAAENEKQAEQFLARQSFDLAVVDLMLEDHDGGFTLCYHIKKKNANVPVILVSSVTHDTGKQFDLSSEAQRSWIKADAILSKPLRFEQIQREIDRLLATPSAE